MHTKQETLEKVDTKFSNSGFGRSLVGEQVWPPKVFVARKIGICFNDNGTTQSIDELITNAEMTALGVVPLP